MAEHIVQYSVHQSRSRDAEPLVSAAALMVARAFRLLDVLADAEEGPTLSELAHTLGMSKGSLHGLLKTLESSQVVEVADDRRYVLGPRIYDLAQRYVHRAGLRCFAVPTSSPRGDSDERRRQRGPPT